MKHTEKLDLILRALYLTRAEKRDQFLPLLCKSNNIPLSSNDEAYIIAKRLEDDGYVRCLRIAAGVMVSLTSHGIEYCEENSYAYKGHSIISNNYNFNISNSPNSNIVSASTHTSIHINNHSEIKNKINQLKDHINNATDVSNSQKDDIIECIEEIEAAVDNNRKPKFALKQLLEQASNVAGIGSLLLDISQLILSQ